MTRNLRKPPYSVALNKHHEQIQLKLQLKIQRERERAVEDNEMGKMLYQLVKQQSAPTVDIEEFDVNSLHYAYFRSMFQEVVEKRIADQQGRLTRLIKLTTGERHIVTEETVWEPIQVVGMLQNRNKQSKIKPEDATACRRLFNFLIKC